MTLRDDLVFFVYLYQRYLYPVDKKRANEFGRAYEEDEDGEGEGENGSRKKGEGEGEARQLAAGAEGESPDAPALAKEEDKKEK
jgi:hypothetical protein